jgi:hypothetical protein
VLSMFDLLKNVAGFSPESRTPHFRGGAGGGENPQHLVGGQIWTGLLKAQDRRQEGLGGYGREATLTITATTRIINVPN